MNLDKLKSLKPTTDVELVKKKRKREQQGAHARLATYKGQQQLQILSAYGKEKQR